MCLELIPVYYGVGLPWELLYPDDLVLIADSIEEVVVKLKKMEGWDGI